LREFGSTPLLLWMLCELFRQTGEIPANLGEVFRVFTQGYEQRLKADVVLEGDRRWWSALLQELATRMMIGDGSVESRVAIDRAEVEATFTAFLRDREAQAAGAARKALDDLLRHHLIQTNGLQVEFRHQLIQEYYAAEWLLVRVKGLDDTTLKQDYLNYLKWTEPVALMLALVDDKALAFRLVERALDVDLILGARLAGKVKHDFQIQAVELLDQTIKNNQVSAWVEVKLWAETLLNIAVRKISLCFEYGKVSPDFTMYALAKLNCDLSEKEIFKICQKCIGDPHYGVYVDSMVEALGCIDLEESVTTLIKLFQYGDSWTCMRTCQALGRIATKKVSSENAVNALFQILNSAGDDEYDSRGMAAEALAEIGSEFVINKLAKILQPNSSTWRQEEEEIQFIAATALTKIGTSIALIALERAYLLGNCEIRQNISHALRNAEVKSEKVWTRPADKNEIGWQREIFGSDFLNRIDDIGLNVATHQWIEQLKDESPITGNYWTIIRTLGFIGTDLSVSALINALISCKQSLEGSVIALALSYSRNDMAAQGIPYLIDLPDPVYSESDDIFSAIQIIQANCKFYNYEIEQQAKLRKADQPSRLEENRPSLEGGGGDRTSLPATITYNVKELTLVSEQQPIFNQYNPTIGVNYAAENSNPKIIQNIQQESQDTSLLAIVQIIQALEKKYTFVQDPQQAIDIIDAEFKSLEASRSPQWQDLLNVKRLYNGGKKAAVKVSEHFTQENVWGKGFVAFLEGVSEDVK
jgi:HEAT repeat protein